MRIPFKVLCIDKGNCNSIAPIEGETYTVIKEVEGWECKHEESTQLFYIIEELDKERAYHSKLFAPLSYNVDKIEENNSHLHLIFQELLAPYTNGKSITELLMGED